MSQYTEKVLPNGIALVAEGVETSRVAAIGFRFAVGSRHEGAGQNGITHFVEHLLFKGTPGMSAFQIAAAFDRIGGYINAYTERECVVVYCVVPAIHAGRALDIICDMTEHSLLREEDVEKEREVIKSEIIASLDDPEEAALDAATAAVFPGDPIAAPISGTIPGISALTTADLRSWYTRHFAEGALSVYLAGSADAALLEERLCRLAPRCAPLPPLPPPRWKGGVTVIPSPFRQTQCFFLTPLPQPLTETRYLGWAVLNALIGDTMSSRLFQLLREEGGYCYSVYSSPTFFADSALWSAYAAAEKRKILPLARTLVAALRRIRADGPTTEEIDAAREHLAGEELIGAEDMESRMRRLMFTHVARFPHRSPGALIDRIRSISSADLAALLSELLNIDDAALVIHGPHLTQKTSSALGELL